MLRRLLRDSGIYGISRLMVRGLSLFLVPLYTRALSPMEYGVLDMLMVFSSLVSLTVALEITQGLARFYSDVSDPDDRVGYASTALFFGAAAYGLFALVGLGFTRSLSAVVLDDPARAATMRVAIVSIAAHGVFLVLQNQLRWELKPRAFAVSGVVYSLVAMGTAVLLVLGFGIGVVGFFWGQLLAAVVAGAMSYWSARGSYALRIDAGKLKDMLRFSVPLVPSSLAVFASMFIDRVAIKELLTLEDVGIYGIGFRLASVANLLMIGVQGALTPIIYSSYREEGTPRDLARAFRYFLALALLMTLGLSVFAPEIIALLTPPAYHAAAVVVPLLIPATLLLRMYIFAPGLDLARRTPVTAAINIVGGLLNIGLNFLLIPFLGLWGAAFASFLGSAAVFGTYMVLSQRHYPVPHDWPRIALATGAITGLLLLGLWLEAPFWVEVALKTALCGAGALVLLATGLAETAVVRRVWYRVVAARPAAP